MSSEHEPTASEIAKMYAYRMCQRMPYMAVLASKKSPGHCIAGRVSCGCYRCEDCKPSKVGEKREQALMKLKDDIEKGRQPFVMHFDTPEWNRNRRKLLYRAKANYVKFLRKDGTTFVVGTVGDKARTSKVMECVVDSQMATNAMEANCRIIVNTTYERKPSKANCPITYSGKWRVKRKESEFAHKGVIKSKDAHEVKKVLEDAGAKPKMRFGLKGWMLSFRLENVDESLAVLKEQLVKKVRGDLRNVAPQTTQVGVMVPVRHKDTILSATLASGQRGMGDKWRGGASVAEPTTFADLPYKSKQNAPLAGQHPTPYTILSSSNKPTHDQLRPRSWNHVPTPNPVSDWTIGQSSTARGTIQKNCDAVSVLYGTSRE